MVTVRQRQFAVIFPVTSIAEAESLIFNKISLFILIRLLKFLLSVIRTIPLSIGQCPVGDHLTLPIRCNKHVDVLPPPFLDPQDTFQDQFIELSRGFSPADSEYTDDVLLVETRILSEYLDDPVDLFLDDKSMRIEMLPVPFNSGFYQLILFKDLQVVGKCPVTHFQ